MTARELLLAKLEALKNGEGIVIKRRQNQFGDMVPDLELRFNNGFWILWQINCNSANTFGLGTCNCYSHPASIEEEISREEALGFLRIVIKRELAEMKYREKEIKWLNQKIEELKNG